MKIRLGPRLLVVELRGRCTHDVIGICPRCWPKDARTLRNKKLALAIAWLDRIRTPDPYVQTLGQAQKMADDAIQHVADLT